MTIKKEDTASGTPDSASSSFYYPVFLYYLLHHLLYRSLIRRPLSLKVLIHETGLNPAVILILSTAVEIVFPINIVVINLADLHIRIYSDRLHTENLQRPVPGEADISKARGHMDKESQPARGRTALQHGDVPIRLRKLVGPSQIQPVWLQME